MSNGITIKGGNVKTGAAAKAAFEQELKPKQIAALFIKVLQANTPVKTGRLRLNWQAHITWVGFMLQILAKNTAPYANRVNTVGRSAGYADRGIEAAKAQVLSQMRVNVGHVAKQLWDKGAK